MSKVMNAVQWVNQHPIATFYSIALVSAVVSLVSEPLVNMLNIFNEYVPVYNCINLTGIVDEEITQVNGSHTLILKDTEVDYLESDITSDPDSDIFYVEDRSMLLYKNDMDHGEKMWENALRIEVAGNYQEPASSTALREVDMHRYNYEVSLTDTRDGQALDQRVNPGDRFSCTLAYSNFAKREPNQMGEHLRTLAYAARYNAVMSFITGTFGGLAMKLNKEKPQSL
jgi:hypothetical protein